MLAWRATQISSLVHNAVCVRSRFHPYIGHTKKSADKHAESVSLSTRRSTIGQAGQHFAVQIYLLRTARIATRSDDCHSVLDFASREALLRLLGAHSSDLHFPVTSRIISSKVVCYRQCPARFARPCGAYHNPFDMFVLIRLSMHVVHCTLAVLHIESAVVAESQPAQGLISRADARPNIGLPQTLRNLVAGRCQLEHSLCLTTDG